MNAKRRKFIILVLAIVSYLDAGIFYFGQQVSVFACPLCLNVDSFWGTPSMHLLRQTWFTVLSGTATALMMSFVILLLSIACRGLSALIGKMRLQP